MDRQPDVERGTDCRLLREGQAQGMYGECHVTVWVGESVQMRRVIVLRWGKRDLKGGEDPEE